MRTNINGDANPDDVCQMLMEVTIARKLKSSDARVEDAKDAKARPYC